MTAGAKAATPGESGATAPSLWRDRRFVVPYLAETQSIAGDQIGRVALSILVFDRTSSAAWTALTYALTFLPAILGGTVLGGLGDRIRRAHVMVGTDAVRAALFLVVAVPGVPLPLVVALVAVAFFLGPAFTSALVSQLAAALTPQQFRTAAGIRMTSQQAVQVLGFAAGGAIVAVIAPRGALVIDACTFALSALLVGLLLRGLEDRRTSAATAVQPDDADDASPAGAPDESDDVVPRLLGERLRPLILLTALAGFFVVPEGLAVPVAHTLHASSRVAGLLLAAGPLGGAIGAAALIKVWPARAGLRGAKAMAVACGLPLIATAALSDWPLVFVCWAVSGALWAYQIDIATALVHAVDDGQRSRVLGRASAVLVGAQGAGLAVFGAIGQWLHADRAVSLAGLVGVGVAVAVVTTARPSRP